MDIRQYVSDKQAQLKQSAERIHDFQVFDFNYIPEKPLMREEAKPLIDAILRYQQTGIPNHLLILGARGSGKSLLARYLMQLMQSHPLEFLYVNCRRHNTSYKILAALLDIRPRGVSLDELWQRVTCRIPSQAVFILDEVDMISTKDRQKDIFYFISRAPQNYMLILLSNNPKFQRSLDESIQSSLQAEIIHFRDYTVEEIRQILTDRARIGLKESPESVIAQIAALTVKNTNSDVRIGLKTLYHWALAPEVPLPAHFDRARRDILEEVVRNLNDKNLLILRAVRDQADGYVKDIYAGYRKLSVQYRDEPFSYVHFYANLSYLQSLGLIVLVSTKVGRTYTNRIQLTFTPEILLSVFQSRFG